MSAPSNHKTAEKKAKEGVIYCHSVDAARNDPEMRVEIHQDYEMTIVVPYIDKKSKIKQKFIVFSDGQCEIVYGQLKSLKIEVAATCNKYFHIHQRQNLVILANELDEFKNDDGAKYLLLSGKQFIESAIYASNTTVFHSLLQIVPAYRDDKLKIIVRSFRIPDKLDVGTAHLGQPHPQQKVWVYDVLDSYQTAVRNMAKLNTMWVKNPIVDDAAYLRQVKLIMHCFFNINRMNAALIGTDDEETNSMEEELFQCIGEIKLFGRTNILTVIAKELTVTNTHFNRIVLAMTIANGIFISINTAPKYGLDIECSNPDVDEVKPRWQGFTERDHLWVKHRRDVPWHYYRELYYTFILRNMHGKRDFESIKMFDKKYDKSYPENFLMSRSDAFKIFKINELITVLQGEDSS